MKSFLLVITGMLCMSFAQCAAAGTFGSGLNTFNIDFVTIGNPGNAADTTGIPNPVGSVPYSYRIGKYEISEQMINKANALGGLGITKDTRGPNKPATGVGWFEAAQFVNWLNTSTSGTPAYKFDSSGNFQLWAPSDAGYNPNNLFRNSLAHYFLPSFDEWYKSAYYDPNNSVYYDYPTGSDSVPDGIDFAGDPNFDAVFPVGAASLQPNDITDVGVLSPYGTAGQGGNVWEWQETEVDLVNDSISTHRGGRGGSWNSNFPADVSVYLRATFRDGMDAPGASNWGFRVASSYVDFADAGPDNSAFVVGDRPGNGGVPAPPVAITLVSLDLLDGSSFTLDPHETLVLTGGPLYIGPGAVFSGNGIVQGSIINAGLLRIPIVRIQTIAQTTGGYIEVQLPEPAAPGDPVIIPVGGGGFAVGEGTMVSFAGGGGGGGQVTPHIVIEGDPAPNDGIIRWDASLEVTGSFEQRETGALRLFIGGNDMPGVNYSQLTVGENVMLAGAIELVFQPELFSEFGYAPMVGETFDLIIADQGITIAATGLTLRSFSTQEGAPLITNLTFSPYGSGIAADPDHLFQIGETIFRLDLVENNTILRATLIHPVNLVPEPSSMLLGLLAGVGLLVARFWRRRR